MRLLIDNNPKQIARVASQFSFIGGQLLTPLTRNSDAGGDYGIDNGAFSGFPKDAWLSLLERQSAEVGRCLFVALPDVVGAARRTLEAFDHWSQIINSRWPLALVAQDGIEDLDIPWRLMKAVFIGGSTEWKMSNAAADVVRCGVIMGRHVHVGRINTPERWIHFDKLGADTCDGSGVSRYDHMLKAIDAAIKNGGRETPLFIGGDSIDENTASVQPIGQ